MEDLPQERPLNGVEGLLYVQRCHYPGALVRMLCVDVSVQPSQIDVGRSVSHEPSLVSLDHGRE